MVDEIFVQGQDGNQSIQQKQTQYTQMLVKNVIKKDKTNDSDGYS